MTTSTFTQGLRNSPKSTKSNSTFSKVARAFSFGPQVIDPAKLGYEATVIDRTKSSTETGSWLDAVIDAPRFTMTDALVIEALANGFVRY